MKPPKIVGLQVGIADRYKAGLWTQVEVTVRGGDEMLSGDLSVIVPDSDGVPGRITRPCQVLPGRDTPVRFTTRFGHVDSELIAEFRVNRRLRAEKQFTASLETDATHFLSAIENRELIVVVGAASVGVEDAGKLAGGDADNKPVTAHVVDIEQLPTQWCAYEGISAVILSTSRPELYRKLTADNARVRALDEWVRMGGRLILCVGSQADQVLAAGHPLAQFSPGKFEKMISLRQTAALESYCSSHTGVIPPGGRKQPMRIPRMVDIAGKIEAHEADVPLIIRTARGFGQVIFFAGDLDQSPLSGWKDRSLLVARLLDMPITASEESKENTAVMHYGYEDLAGQLRSALDRFTGVRLVPFWFVAALIVVYILLIGPGDYFFLRKVVRRMEWTWLTFPVIVVVVSVGAYVLAYKLKGDRLRVNQVDLVDVDAASGHARGATWLNIFSPRMESFNLTVQPREPNDTPAAEARVWMGWLGLSGRAMGGMNSPAAGPRLWSDCFNYAPNLSALVGVPIQVWSTKSLTARWEMPTAAYPAAELAETDQMLSGSITNTLPFALRNCLLAHGRYVYDLGPLAPGESARLGQMSKRSELKTWLTGLRTVVEESGQVGEKYRQEATPYDRSSVDPMYILRTMMFYQAAGGRGYAGLSNDYQKFVDLSDLLQTGRAILIARGAGATDQAPQVGAVLLRDSQPLVGPEDQHRTMYRFIFPVKKTKD
ncbi:MAG: hypothetical protein LLG00_00960 [Planctomycetaceae bacterium]|nr:hypothetical protein [Planctomycetaceae bacterium]